VEKLVKSEGVKIKTSFKNCLKIYNDHFFDLKGSWDFDDLMTPKMILNLFPEEILNLPVIIDSKHVVLELPGSGVEVFNMIPEYLVETTMR
jgi:hypothetical protein